MRLEFYKWLIKNNPTKNHLSTWDSNEVGYPLGYFIPTKNPLRKLAPTAYECEAYPKNSILDSAAVILEILSQLQNSTALINTFWQSLMLGDLGLYPEHNKLPNDLDVSIIAPLSCPKIHSLILSTAEQRVTQRNKFPPTGMFSTSIIQSSWPEIPQTVQVNYVLPHLYNERPSSRPMLELHPISLRKNYEQTLSEFMMCYAPFYILSHGLSLLAVTAHKIRSSTQHYYIFSQFPPEYKITQSLVNVFPVDAGNHTIALTAHTKPTPRLAIIGIRIAEAAVIGSVGKREPIKINDKTLKLIRESQKEVGQSEKLRIKLKIQRIGEKVGLVQKHLNRVSRELESPVFCHMNKPNIPFPETESTLVDAYQNYLKIMGFDNLD